MFGDDIPKDISSALVYYAGQGNLTKVKECIKQGANVNAKYQNLTALHKAIEGRYINVIQYLLTVEALDINAIDDYLHESTLIKAVFNRLPEIVDLLLTKDGINYHIQGHLTGTALTYAIFSNQNDVAKKLLARETVFHNQDHPGAINCAVIRESEEMLALLIAKGADVDTPGYEGAQETPDYVWQMNPDENTYPAACGAVFTTPLCCAVEQGSLCMLKSLVKTYRADPDRVTARKETALILAARQSNEVIFQFLMDNGTNLQQLIDGRTIETIIREDHLISYKMKALLSAQAAAAHGSPTYHGSFVPTIGQL